MHHPALHSHLLPCCPGCMVQAMATTTLGLKRHVFQQGSSVSAQLLKVACLCLKRMVELLDGWVYEKEPQGTVSIRHPQSLCCCYGVDTLVKIRDHTEFCTQLPSFSCPRARA